MPGGNARPPGTGCVHQCSAKKLLRFFQGERLVLPSIHSESIEIIEVPKAANPNISDRDKLVDVVLQSNQSNFRMSKFYFFLKKIVKFIYLMTRKVHTKYWHIYSMGKRKIPTRYLIKSKSSLGTTKWGSCELERQEWWMHACTVRKEKKPEARDQRWADREGQGEDKHSIRPHLTWWSCWWNRGPHLLSDPCPESKHLTRGWSDPVLIRGAK